MFFAAKEFVEKRAMNRGLPAGRQAERERIQRELAQRGVPLTPEQLRIVDREAGSEPE